MDAASRCHGNSGHNRPPSLNRSITQTNLLLDDEPLFSLFIRGANRRALTRLCVSKILGKVT